MQSPAFVYLLHCADGTLYTGWTFDLARRVATHQRGRGARYTRTRLPVELIYHERLRSRRAAMRREIAIKKMSRARKLALVIAREATAKRPGGKQSPTRQRPSHRATEPK
jgi:putative endonuclease